MAEKTYMKILKAPFDAQVLGNSPAAIELRAELFGTNGNNGNLIEVTVDAGRVRNDGVEAIYKTSKYAKLLGTVDGVDIWARMPPGTPRGTVPADLFVARFAGEMLTHAEALAIVDSPEWTTESPL